MTFIEGIKVPLADPIDERDRMWERNHKKIAECIRDSLYHQKVMPTVSYIVLHTNLHRNTVRKHLKEFGTTPGFKEQTAKYKVVIGELMNKLGTMGLSGNISAIRLYMELMGMIKTSHIVNQNFVNTQTNYVQINGIELTEEKIKALTKEQLLQIESILNPNINVQRAHLTPTAEAATAIAPSR